MFDVVRSGLVFAALLGCGIVAHAAVPRTQGAVRAVTADVDDGDRVPVRGEISALTATSQDLGPEDGAMLLQHVTLVMKRSAARQSALDRLVHDQLTRGNPAYGQWVKPGELFGAFGPAPGDIAQVCAWLRRHDLTVNRVTADGMIVDFRGSVRAIEAAFGTALHRFQHRGETHFANVSEPLIPRALGGAIAGVTLHNFGPRPASRDLGMTRQDARTGKWTLTRPSPDFITPVTPFGQFQAIGPNDFAVIYNVLPLRTGNALTMNQPVTGLGSTIALLGDSAILPNDFTRFRKGFGLAGYKGSLTIQNPGNCGDPGRNQDEGEAALDAEWGGISAPDADVILAVCPSTNFSTNSGIFTALENMVSLGTPAQMISVSFTFCEAGYGPSALQAWSQAAEEGAAEGISIFVAAGDGSSDGCDNFDTAPYSTSGLAVNGLASNPYVTAVGGTDYADIITGQGSVYFAGHNRKGRETALSYVPEITWSQNCASPVLLAVETALGKTDAATPTAFCNSTEGAMFLNIVGGSGGRSAVYAKPDWQTLDVFGVPNDGARDLPDVSSFASGGFYGHFTIFCDSDASMGGKPCDYGNGTDVLYNAVGGTSVAAPSFAGIMLLETQLRAILTGQTAPLRIGLVAPRLYQLAADEFSTGFGLAGCNASLGNAIGAACVFHNVTANGNSVPCLKATPDCVTDKDSTAGLGVLSDGVGRSATEAYLAAPGYNLANGLGSVNALNLLAAY